MAEQINMWESEGIIKIKPKAYITMLKHVLQYGNDALGPDSVEVMGICMGKEENGNIVVYEAIPISHGSSIEVGFTPADYAAFAQIDEEYSKKGTGLYACGWYHSHPGMGAFLSNIDIKNHLFYQKEQTPKGFALVFDHKYLNDPEGEAPFGFKAFRLNDFTRGTSSDFHESKYEILVPDDLSFYKEIKDIIERYQSKKPLIEEIAMLEADESIWDMEDSAEAKEAVEKVGEAEKDKEGKLSEVEQLEKSADEASELFTKEFTSKFLKHFDQFKNDMAKATQKGGTVMVDSLATMKEIVQSGTSRIRKYFEDVINKEIENVNKDLTETFKKMDNDQREFNKNFFEFSKKITEQISETVKQALSGKIDVVIQELESASEKATAIASKSKEFQSTLINKDKLINDLAESLEKDTQGIENAINELKTKISEDTSEQAKSLIDALDDLNSIVVDMDKIINKLAKKIK
ncbi:MAG: hypothetical protein ACTSRZ_16795 [Promethearchaeota archaeon]